jgi:hypothetical protein
MIPSNDFLLITGEHLFKKSSNDEYFQFFSLSLAINSQTSAHIHFTEKNHNLIPFSATLT